MIFVDIVLRNENSISCVNVLITEIVCILQGGDKRGVWEV